MHVQQEQALQQIQSELLMAQKAWCVCWECHCAVIYTH